MLCGVSVRIRREDVASRGVSLSSADDFVGFIPGEEGIATVLFPGQFYGTVYRFSVGKNLFDGGRNNWM